jgi:hypothetical protein
MRQQKPIDLNGSDSRSSVESMREQKKRIDPNGDYGRNLARLLRRPSFGGASHTAFPWLATPSSPRASALAKQVGVGNPTNDPLLRLLFEHHFENRKATFRNDA